MSEPDPKPFDPLLDVPRPFVLACLAQLAGCGLFLAGVVAVLEALA